MNPSEIKVIDVNPEPERNKHLHETQYPNICLPGVDAIGKLLKTLY